MVWDRLWLNANLATMAGPDPFGSILDAAIATSGGRIAWIGARAALPGDPRALAHECIDAGGAWITPGLIDAHTHLVFAGDRSGEFQQRLQGASYQQIAAAGGGIRSTVAAVRAATVETLTGLALERADRLAAYGVTTVEIKSGYGLTLADERKQLLVARDVGRQRALRVRTTFLGAHTLAPEFTDRTAYLNHVARDMLPALAAEGLVDAVDAFCDTVGFSAAELEALLATSTRLGLPVKLHADQLSDAGAAALAARHGALSADHVEYTNAAGIEAMARAGTVAVLLPAAWYFLREQQRPPIQAFRAHGVPMALASDCNPGTAPVLNPGVIMNLACVCFGLTPAEALAGYTREAARALGLDQEIGTLTVGKRADLAIWHCHHPAELSYWIDGLAPSARVWNGQSTPLPAPPP